MKPNTNCETCGKAIYKKPWEIKAHHVYCSHPCYAEALRQKKTCPACSAVFIGQKKSCSRACANRLRTGIRYGSGRLRDKAATARSQKLQLLELRGPRCERCGYDRVAILVVHHKDRDRTNNDQSNLELLCPNCHAMEHYGENSQVPRVGGKRS